MYQGPWYLVVYAPKENAFVMASHHAQAIAFAQDNVAVVYIANTQSLQKLEAHSLLVMDATGMGLCSSAISSNTF